MSVTSDEVYLLKEDEVYGPHPIEGLYGLLESGWLSPEHLYWRNGLSEWTPVAELLAPVTPLAVEKPVEVDATVSAFPSPPIHDAPPRIVYRPQESGFISYGLGLTLAFYILLFLGLTWRLGYASEVPELLTVSSPPAPPLEITMVTEEEPAPPPPPPPPPPETAEAPPPDSLPPPPAIPDVLPPPPPAQPEMALASPPIPAPPVPSLPQVAEDLPKPVQTPPPVRKKAAVSPPTSVPAAPEAIVQANPTDYLDAPPPTYPYASQLSRQTGTVNLLVTLDGEGQPLNVSVYQSSGWPALDQAARTQVLHRWRFKPGNSSRVLVPIEFSLPY